MKIPTFRLNKFHIITQFVKAKSKYHRRFYIRRLMLIAIEKYSVMNHRCNEKKRQILFIGKHKNVIEIYVQICTSKYDLSLSYMQNCIVMMPNTARK